MQAADDDEYPDSGANGAAPSDSTPPDAEDAETPEEPKDPLEEAKAEATRFREQLLRTAADFDNFRKRNRRELEDADRRGREDMLKELLPVFDNLERAASHAVTASDVASLGEGIRMVLRQFSDVLGRLQIERIESDGQMFDPMVHEAIQQLETTEHPPGTITAEVQAGYRLGDHLIRPAMVVVAKAPIEPEPGPPATEDGGDDGAAADEPSSPSNDSADAEEESAPESS